MSGNLNNTSISRIFYENEFKSEQNTEDYLNEKFEIDPLISITQNIKIENELITKKSNNFIEKDYSNNDMSQHSRTNSDKLNISDNPMKRHSILSNNSNHLLQIHLSPGTGQQPDKTENALIENDEIKSWNKLIKTENLVELNENKTEINQPVENININKTVEVIFIPENNSSNKADSEKLFQIENTKSFLNDNKNISINDALPIVSINSKKSENSNLKNSSKLNNNFSNDLDEEIRFKIQKENSYDDRAMKDFQGKLSNQENTPKVSSKEISDINKIIKTDKSNEVTDPTLTTEKNAFLLFVSTVKKQRMAEMEKEFLNKNRCKFSLNLKREHQFDDNEFIDKHTYYLILNYKETDIEFPLKNLGTSNSFGLIQVENDLGINIKSICEYLSTILDFVEKFGKSFHIFLKPLDINLYLLFLIINRYGNKWINIKDFNILELKLKEGLNMIKFEDAICEIQEFVEFIKKNLYLNNLENLTDIDEDLNKIRYTNLYSEIIAIRNLVCKYFFLNSTDSENPENYLKNNFNLYLKKILNYLQNSFPFCCGRNELNKLRKLNKQKIINKISEQYDKVNFDQLSHVFFCFKCRFLICQKCLKFHKNHKIFNFMNLKSENIKSDYLIETIFKELFITNENDNKVENSKDKNIQDNSILQIGNGNRFWTIIEIILLEFMFKSCVELSNSQKFQEFKKKFLDDKNLSKSIFMALNKHRNSSILEENISENLYKTSVNKYQKLILLEVFNQKPNEILMDELFINNLSLELNVNKSILYSNNNELNYDISSDYLTYMISQKNSSFDFYRENFFGSRNNCGRVIYSKDIDNSSKNYLKNIKAFSTDLKILSLAKSQQKDCINHNWNENYFSNNDEVNVLKIDNLLNTLTPQNGKKNSVTVYNKIIQRFFKYKNCNSYFKKTCEIYDIRSHNYHNDHDHKHPEFLDEFCPKLNIFNFFIEDLIKKFKSLGTPLLEKSDK